MQVSHWLFLLCALSVVPNFSRNAIFEVLSESE